MSIKIMAEIWENGPRKQADRFVLLALADYANDEGECWPSIPSICRKVCMSDRGVQKALHRLEADGWLEIRVGGGRKNCNFYAIKTPNETAETPNDVHPERRSPPPENPERRSENPERRSDEPSRTTKNRQCARDRIESVLCKSLSKEVASDFFDHRKSLRKPLTEKAAQLIVSRLSDCPCPDEVANLSIMNGWQGVFPERFTSPKSEASSKIDKYNRMGRAPK